jgi:hypothetical protein
MLQIIRKIFPMWKKKGKTVFTKVTASQGKNALWAERQIREMAKLGGKLVL